VADDGLDREPPQLTLMLDATQGVLASPAWSERPSEFDTAMIRVERHGDRWIDIAFRRGLLLIAALFVARTHPPISRAR
jgi:hypothetical protein